MAKIRRYDQNIVAGGDIKQDRTTVVVHGDHYTSGGDQSIRAGKARDGRETQTSTTSGARTCTACGGTRGWSMVTRGGTSVTMHTACGAVQ